MTTELQVLTERVEKLEEMLKERAHVVSAEAFILTDANRKMRATLLMEQPLGQNPVAILTLYDKDGNVGAQLREGTLVLGDDRHLAQLGATDKGVCLIVREGGQQGNTVSVAAAIDGPQIALLDAGGYKTAIGNCYAGFPEFRDAMSVLHASQQTRLTAASVIMWDKEVNVLWSAPPPKRSGWFRRLFQ